MPGKGKTKKALDSIPMRNKSIMKIISKPNTTDSLAVYMTNKDSRSSYAPISKAAQKKYGAIDVKNFNPSKMGNYNVAKARKKYKL